MEIWLIASTQYIIRSIETLSLLVPPDAKRIDPTNNNRKDITNSPKFKKSKEMIFNSIIFSALA